MQPLPFAIRHAVRSAALAGACLLLAACSGGGSAPRPAQPAPPPAEFRQGDLRISASTTPTRQLDAGIARGYGIPRSDDGVLVLVTVREGPEGAGTALESQVAGWATDLQGRRHALAFRELRAGGFVDQAAVLDVRAPDTLQFHLTVTPRGRPAQQLDFVREFHPR
jgi:hypothetical protein